MSNTSSSREPKIYKKAINAYNGFVMSWKDDKSIRIAYISSLLVSLPMFIFQPNIVTKVLSLLIYLLWILTETINTSIESSVNNTSLVSKFLQPLVIKDKKIDTSEFNVSGKCNINNDTPSWNCQAALSKDTGATLSGIVVLFMAIATGLFIYNIYIKHKKWKKEQEENNKSSSILEYIKWTFSN